MFKNILCATDGSDAANQAVHIAWDLSCKYSGRLTVMYVAPLRLLHLMAAPRGPMIAEDLLPRQVEERLTHRAEEVLRQTLDLLGPQAQEQVKTLHILGHPGDAICEAVEEHGFDMVVIGSRGQSSLKRAIMGSVSDYVAHHCVCPVLVVKDDPEDGSA